MTTITLPRAVVEQALEALEYAQQGRECPSTTRQAITDLRAALAQQDEPVAGRAFLERILTAMEDVLDVADRKTDEFDALRSCVIDLTLMLHTAPPQRQPLTEEAAALTAQRDALLEALKYLDKAFRQHGRQHWPEAVRVGAAIKAVEEQK